MTQERNRAYPYLGCCLCGQTVGEQFVHLDHDADDNDPDNLAWLCRHHRWMVDIGLFSPPALKEQRTGEPWRTTRRTSGANCWPTKT